MRHPAQAPGVGGDDLSRTTDDARRRSCRWRPNHRVVACQHQIEPDPAELAERYAMGVAVLDWRDRLVCSRCGSRDIDIVLTGERR